jgi:hypothetical protein
MRAFLVSAAAVLGFGLLLSLDRPDIDAHGTPQARATGSVDAPETASAPPAPSSIASYPDRGELLAYDDKRQVVHSGASTWQPVQVSERHALRAIAEGGMNVRAPNGEMIHLRYERHVEHADGNWTWIGRQEGGAPGTETVLTFGEKAVFGTVRQGSADLSLTTEAGSTWLVQTDYSRVDPKAIANDDDFLSTAGMPDPVQPARRAPTAPGASAAVATALAPTTIDIAMGFTTGFATRLGGQSQAQTRLHFLVDTANQAYVASGINGQLRLVHAVQVTYPDGTHNDSALFDLTGVDCTQSTSGAHYRSFARFNCTPRAHPAALQPLVSARATHGADLLVLIRKFEASSTSCGVAWLLGGGQNPINASSAAFGTTVVNDSSGEMFPDNGVTCPDLHLAHELGHNMGQQHDVVTAMGTDDSDSNGNLLDPEEFGYHPYSFGYSTDGTAADIATIMSNRRSSQTRYKVFANPLISACGGAPCGIADQADNARSMTQVMPFIAAFRAATQASIPRDFDGDGRSDVLWRSTWNGANVLWKSASVAQNLASLADQDWFVAGIGDFGGDGRSDIVWRHATNGSNAIWHSGTTNQNLANVAGSSWRIVGVGDFDGDGRSDLLWRNSINGANTLWKSGTIGQALTAVSDQNWKVAAVGDFDGDGRSDIAWRHMTSGQNEIWKGGNSSTKQTLATVAATSWKIVGASDFDGDGRSDLLWRNTSNGANTLWKGATVGQTLTSLPDQSWQLAMAADFNGDGRSDIMWRNLATGANQIWNSADSATPRSLSTVTLTWKVVPSAQ